MLTAIERAYRFTEITANSGRHTDASHGSDTNYLALMLDGRSRIVCPTHEINMTENDVFFIPKGCRYHSYWYGDGTVSWVTLGFSEFPEADEGYRLQKLKVSDSKKAIIKSLGKHKKIDSASLGLFYALLSDLLPQMEKEPTTACSAVYFAASEYMRINPTASVAELARHCRVSESGLFAAFRKHGTTPVLTRQKMQIEEAVKLLSETALSADEIAERVGFASTSYFLRTLKKFTGKTTRGLRNGVEI